MKQKPFDVHLILGDDKTGKQVATINVDFELKPQNIAKVCKRAEIRQPVGEDLIIKFDFSTQEGREKECIEYFESGLDNDDKDTYDYDLSPLQNWFRRPKKSGKLDLYESTNAEGKGRISLEYRIYKEEIQQEEEGIIEAMKKFKESTFHPDLNLQARFYGDVETSKKNRVKLKLQYIDIHATSQQFKMKDLLNLISILGIFEEEQENIVSHPMFHFLQNAEEIQLKLKLASIRKIVHLYEIGVTEANTMKQRKRQHPDVIKGLFKDEVRVTFIYSDTLAFVAKYHYKSEFVLIRMLTGMKKYLKYFD